MHPQTHIHTSLCTPTHRSTHPPSHHLCQPWPCTEYAPHPIKWGPQPSPSNQGNNELRGDGMGWAKSRLFSRVWREWWRDGSQVGERRRWRVMGMVLGHIFNHVTKKVPAWETRQCFSNPAGCLRSALLHSAHFTFKIIQREVKRSLTSTFFSSFRPD